MEPVSANAWSFLGGSVLVILSIGVAYWFGSRFAKVRFENKGHENVEKTLVKTLDQYQTLDKKYHGLLGRLYDKKLDQITPKSKDRSS